ncbi:hypothetical protein HAZT_HAZT009097 [Hyalella azteca]|uniref:Alpha-1,6-mannosyl-glycoprotein 2-beta-N-acetylglucosaminyltransferase n=1 Tax=Hyalella azteca TaxID=294128 RepID=A0A6A0GQU7_HYAAZ|nr:hypothetical protein HAZT_HAZT009097 [Hyalella azteca]
MQVFYPHTLQLHPTSFPGHSPGDCPRDTDRKIAKELQCRGNPDLYGHYREPRYTQTKNHWWWKANKVFDAVLTPLNHSGLVLFLEEDHYVSEDLLHMLTLLSAALPHACPHCSLLTLGNYLKNYNWPGDAKKVSSLMLTPVEVSPWLSSKHNMGFAFNRTTWQKIKACGVGFCTHDDYNWDWSLQHVSNTCLQQRLHTMVLRAPRVFHIGECGVHHKKKDCSSKLVLNKVYRTLQSGRRALFPLKLIIMQAPPKKIKKHKGNGGWGDHRDQELCKAFLTSTGLFSPLVQEPSPPERPAPRNRTLGAPIHRTNSTSQRPPKDNVFPDILPRTGKSSRDKNPHLSEGGGFKEKPAIYQHGKAARSSSRDKPYLAERGFVARVSSVMRQPQVITVSYDGSTDDGSDVAAAVPHYLDPRHPLNPSHHRHDPLDPASLSLQSLSHEASAPGMPLVQQVHSIALNLHHPAIGSESELLRRGHPIAAKEVDDSDQVITYEEGRDLRMHRRSIS